MGNDLSLTDLYQKASEIDDILDEQLEISFDEDLGYLTIINHNT
jgi:protein arginine kinase